MSRMSESLVVLIALLLHIPSDAEAAGGWQKLRWGANEGEVKRLYPSVTKLNPDDENEKSPPGQGCTLGMIYTTDDKNFKARFCFDREHELQSVILRPIPPLNSQVLLQLLTQKYGEPENDAGNTVLLSVHWREDDTLITLFAIPDVTCLQSCEPHKDAYATLSYTAALNSANRGL